MQIWILVGYINFCSYLNILGYNGSDGSYMPLLLWSIYLLCSKWLHNKRDNFKHIILQRTIKEKEKENSNHKKTSFTPIIQNHVHCISKSNKIKAFWFNNNHNKAFPVSIKTKLAWDNYLPIYKTTRDC